jgi:hypothetical protein
MGILGVLGDDNLLFIVKFCFCLIIVPGLSLILEMPTFIKTGFWEKHKSGYKGWLNLDDLFKSFL